MFFFLFAMNHFDRPITIFLKHWTCPKIEVQMYFALAKQLHLLCKFNFGERLRDKVWCYCNHLGKQVGNIIKNFWGAHQQHGGNIKIQKNGTPTTFHHQKMKFPRCMLSPLIGYMRIIFLKLMSSFVITQANTLLRGHVPISVSQSWVPMTTTKMPPTEGILCKTSTWSWEIILGELQGKFLIRLTLHKKTKELGNCITFIQNG